VNRTSAATRAHVREAARTREVRLRVQEEQLQPRVQEEQGVVNAQYLGEYY